MASRSSPLPTTPRRRGGTFRAGRLLGFDIALHWSWPLAVLFIAWSLQGGYLPTVYPEWTDRQRWTVGFGAGLLMFGSVLAHELAHAVVARRRGYPAAGITLWLFGGASELEHEPRTARDEAWIALAGPLLTVVLAAAFAGLWAAGRALGLDALYPIASYLALSNALLAVFNLLPALPLDGGRVVRAVVWERSGSMLSGTRVAARAGRFLAGGLVAIGFLLLLRGYGFDGLWLAFMGWFLWGAASTSYQHQLLEISLSGVPVESLAEHDTPRVAPDLTLRELAREMQGAAGARAYFVSPVSEGDILGMVTVTDLGRVPEENWDTTSVYRAMTPRDQLVTVPTGTDAFAALRLMAVRNLTQLPVFQGREPRGLLTRAALQRAVQVRTAVGGER